MTRITAVFSFLPGGFARTKHGRTCWKPTDQEDKAITDKTKKRSLAVFLSAACLFTASCGAQPQKGGYVLDESTFFLVMTNIQYYPERYTDMPLEMDLFTYELKDAEGKSWMCGVRKCSAEYGCTCGNDTIIGFILDTDRPIPEPANQGADNNEKTWIHLKGKLGSKEKTDIIIPSYLSDGTANLEVTETLSLLTFRAEDISLIEDASGLSYYVTK